MNIMMKKQRRRKQGILHEDLSVVCIQLGDHRMGGEEKSEVKGINIIIKRMVKVGAQGKTIGSLGLRGPDGPMDHRKGALTIRRISARDSRHRCKKRLFTFLHFLLIKNFVY